MGARLCYWIVMLRIWLRVAALVIVWLFAPVVFGLIFGCCTSRSF